MVDLDTRRAQLTRLLEALNNQLHGIEDELESHHNRDWEELAVEREGDEVLEGLGNKGQAEIRQIKSALARMDAGEYPGPQTGLRLWRKHPKSFRKTRPAPRPRPPRTAFPGCSRAGRIPQNPMMTRMSCSTTCPSKALLGILEAQWIA